MSVLNLNSFLLILVLLSSAVLEESSTVELHTNVSKINLFPKTKVEMFNKLPKSASLTIQCKSKDDDLGTHVLRKGQSYSFRFRFDLLGTTLFFCGASWKGRHVVFDIYKAERDNPGRCHTYCRWEAREDAIVGFKQDDQTMYDVVLPWNY